MADTTNSVGEIISGTKVIIKNKDVIYDVGEVHTGKATLYLRNKEIGTFPLSEIVPV